MNKFIVLDLDETLVNSDIITKKDWKKVSKSFNLENTFGESFYMLNLDADNVIVGIKRPYCDQFIDYCLTYFSKVYIWSAGKSEYVNIIVNYLFQGKKLPYKVLSWPDCDYEIDEDGDKNPSKPLEKLGLNMRDLLFVDDQEKYAKHNFANWICIPAFEFPSILDKNNVLDIETILKKDDYLLKIIEWINEKNVLSIPDVRILNKQFLYIEDE